MINFNKKEAFSLAESIIFLTIIILAFIFTIIFITKKSTIPVSKIANSGMYACWKDSSGELKHTYYNGSKLNNKKSNLTPKQGFDCKFEMNRHVSEFYIYAVGNIEYDAKEKKYIDAQVKQAIVPAPSGNNEAEMTLDIKLALKDTQNQNTSVKQNGTEILSAAGGLTYHKNGLVSSNIKRCKVQSTNLCDVKDSRCSVGNEDIVITCKKENDNSNDKYNTELSKIGKPDSNGIYTFYNKKGNKLLETKIKIQLKDSELTSNYKDNINELSFIKYLKIIPQNMQNDLTNILLKEYQKTGVNKDGIVLIIW